MKVTIERTALLKALGHVHRIVERRNTIPILSNVLIEARERQVTLKSTDLDLEATESAPADVASAGATTVPAHVIYDIVRKLPEGAQVSLEMTGEAGQLLLRSGRSRFFLQSLPASDFPDLTAGEFTHRFVLAAADLKRLIDNTQFAISTEETRYYLNGIFFHTVDVGGATLLRAVATDGHRLARVEIPAPQGAAGMPGVIAPRKAVSEVQKLLEDMTQEVAVEISTTKARFQFGDVVLTTKLIDGTFPDYSRVIPTHNDKRLVVDKQPFAKRGRSRLDDFFRARPRDQTGDRRQQDDALRQQSRFGFGERGNRSRLRFRADRDRLQRALPPRHRRATRRRHGADQAVRSRLADDHPGSRRLGGALRADAAQGVRAAKGTTALSVIASLRSL